VEEGEKRGAERSRVGLCADCRHVRRMKSDRGSIFYLCERSRTDSNFANYPALPIVECSGYEAGKRMTGHDDDVS